MPKPCSRYRLFNQDCLKAISKIAPKSIDTIITDPPYGLNFMSKEWDHGVPGRGFWARFRRACKPGALLLAFGGTRTYHRLACAIEDGGWEIRDCIMWIYGSGFPKSHNISKAIDKAAGAEREVVGKHRAPCANVTATPAHGGSYQDSPDITAPATPAAKEWEGYGTALKPAWEPVILAMKPLDGTYAQNALKHGVAGINVDASRIASPENVGKVWTRGGKQVGASLRTNTSGENEYVEAHPSGRWPANLILSHHESCVQVGVKKASTGTGPKKLQVQPCSTSDKEGKSWSKGKHKGFHYGEETVEAWECHPDCPVGMLDEQSGECPSRGRYTKSKTKPMFENKGTVGPVGLRVGNRDNTYAGESGGASRFFYCAKTSKRERNDGLPEGITNNHPTVKPLGIIEYLCRLTAPPGGGVVFDPFMGSGTTGVACARTGRRFVGCEIDEEHGYFDVAQRRIIEAYKST